MFRFTVLALSLVVLPCIAIADEVLLNDGSTLIGQVQVWTEGKAVLQTDFNDHLEIDATKIRGITTDAPRSVQLLSGDRAVGTLNFTPEGGQTINAEALGNIGFELDRVSAIWAAGEESPDVVALRNKLANIWSANIQLGINGQTGNTEQLAINGSAEIKRTTDTDRLTLYGKGRFSKENGQDTVKEVIGGISLEVDINEKWFTFVTTEMEFDKFENIDLRATVSGGLGYYAIREADEDLKFRAGIGFQHESFNTGTSTEEAVANLGWDYRKEVSPWCLFTHSVSIFPKFEDLNDFRMVMDNALEFPLNGDKDWSLKVGMTNNYDAMPQMGIRRLDTFYYFNIARNFN